MGVPFLLLGAALAFASFGWFQRRIWGWWLAVITFGTQVLGNLVNISMGHIFEGMLGTAIAGALLYYLLGANVRATFGKNREPTSDDRPAISKSR
jgi:hypothetical protein